MTPYQNKRKTTPSLQHSNPENSHHHRHLQELRNAFKENSTGLRNTWTSPKLRKPNDLPVEEFAETIKEQQA
jgi:hypothetical protein